jgi:hypothetical protein
MTISKTRWPHTRAARMARASALLDARLLINGIHGRACLKEIDAV